MKLYQESACVYFVIIILGSQNEKKYRFIQRSPNKYESFLCFGHSISFSLLFLKCVYIYHFLVR